jgi:hypothetical protein
LCRNGTGCVGMEVFMFYETTWNTHATHAFSSALFSCAVIGILQTWRCKPVQSPIGVSISLLSHASFIVWLLERGGRGFGEEMQPVRTCEICISNQGPTLMLSRQDHIRWCQPYPTYQNGDGCLSPTLPYNLYLKSKRRKCR